VATKKYILSPPFYLLCLYSQKIYDDMTAMGIFYWVYCIVAILVMVRVVLNNRDTVKTLAWILVFIFLPFLGLIIYFFFGRDTRKTR